MKTIIKRLLLLITGKVTLTQAYNYLLIKYSTESVRVSYKPIRLGIFVTGKCNLKCSMCLTHSPTIPDNPFKYKGAKDMDIETFKKIIKTYPASTIISLIGNGEPLLNNDIFKIINYSKKHKKKITLFSNGLIINKYFDQLVEHQLDSINISINAINATEYMRFTGHDEKIFNDCLANLKALVKLKNDKMKNTTIHCSIIVDKFNYKSMPAMIKFAEEVGVDNLPLCHYIPSPTESNKVERLITTSDKDAINLINQLALGEYSVDVTFPRVLDGNNNNRFCRDSMASMSIDGNGNIGGCERQLLNTEGQGKYFDTDAFNNNHFVKLRDTFLNGKGELSDPCKTCYNNTSFQEISIKAKKIR